MSSNSTSAESADPWMAAMRRGDFATAWRVSDEHLRRRLLLGAGDSSAPRHLEPIWDGTPLPGKDVLVRCYHGLGDTIQFIRFARRLGALARTVTVWVQPSLMALVATAVGVDRVLALHDGTPAISYDVDIEIMELAHALRISAQELPGDVPYLFPVETLPFVPSTEFRVGLIWSAGDWDQSRSLPTSLLKPLAGVPNVRLHSLQRGPAAAQAADISAIDISTPDIDELVTILRGLELVISVDSFVAHLAGALNVPVWLLLKANCDWRWMDRGDRSIWYPSMRLFRQHTPGDWRNVIDEVASELAAAAQNIEGLAKPPEQTNTIDVRTS